MVAKARSSLSLTARMANDLISRGMGFMGSQGYAREGLCEKCYRDIAVAKLVSCVQQIFAFQKTIIRPRIPQMKARAAALRTAAHAFIGWFVESVAYFSLPSRDGTLVLGGVQLGFFSGCRAFYELDFSSFGPGKFKKAEVFAG
jgi:hypothetical protein